MSSLVATILLVVFVILVVVVISRRSASCPRPGRESSSGSAGITGPCTRA